MKKIIAVIFCCVFLFTISVTHAFSSEVSTSAGASVLLCANNGKVLYSHNMDTRMKMASTTKIMTALLTLENAEKDNRVVTFKVIEIMRIDMIVIGIDIMIEMKRVVQCILRWGKSFAWKICVWVCCCPPETTPPPVPQFLLPEVKKSLLKR